MVLSRTALRLVDGAVHQGDADQVPRCPTLHRVPLAHRTVGRLPQDLDGGGRPLRHALRALRNLEVCDSRFVQRGAQARDGFPDRDDDLLLWWRALLPLPRARPCRSSTTWHWRDEYERVDHDE